ncbi:MAG: integrase core domain-containing protein [Alphaproteobacteria bacterium]|nr:integrase core domain-containing protein [Alphaproteobacteria bacterium]
MITRELDQLVARRGMALTIISDNDTELTCRVTLDWAAQNGITESLNGRVHDECLNEHILGNLAQTRKITGDWQKDFNQIRPHSSLRNRGIKPRFRYHLDFGLKLKG